MSFPGQKLWSPAGLQFCHRAWIDADLTLYSASYGLESMPCSNRERRGVRPSLDGDPFTGQTRLLPRCRVADAHVQARLAR